MQATPTDLLQDVIQMQDYDNKGKLRQVRKFSNISMSYLWDESISQPIAQIQNATAQQVAYTSFENDGAMGNWTKISGSIVTTSAFTGSKSLSTGTIQFTITQGGDYTVMVWSGAGTPSIDGFNTPQPIKTAGGWKLYMWELANLSAAAQVRVNGSIDEARLFPTSAVMETFTYKPHVGIQTHCDSNGLVTFYKYDDRNRLTGISDCDGNLVKSLNYHFRQQ
jgi:hypothetical protein